MTISEVRETLALKGISNGLQIIDNRLRRPIKTLIRTPVILRMMPDGKYMVEIRNDWGYVARRSEFSNENDACEEIIKYVNYMSEYFNYGTNHR